MKNCSFRHGAPSTSSLPHEETNNLVMKQQPLLHSTDWCVRQERLYKYKNDECALYVHKQSCEKSDAVVYTLLMVAKEKNALYGGRMLVYNEFCL